MRTSGEPVSSDLLETAIGALSHRGPDARGTYSQASERGAIGFSHVRLSILDLSDAGAQPMTTDDGRYSICYNGEVYNYRAVRDELEALGETFVSSGDTEVVLRAYARFGRDAVARLRGMFAFAVWDAKTGALFLARDRLGVKPLYYAESRRGFFFASELRALLATGAAPRTLGRRGLASYLAMGSVAEPDTIVKGVRMLPAGTTLEVSTRVGAPQAYWEIPYRSESAPKDPQRAFERACDELRPALADAVGLRLIADVPVGVFLSGGIDSSAIVALAAEESRAPVHTFTVTFDERAHDEARFAKLVADRFGCVHREVHLPAARAEAEMERAASALDQPSADGINTYFVSLAAHEAGLKVALSGLGGDELFAGYPWFSSFGRLLSLSGKARGAAPALSWLSDALSRWGAVPKSARKLLALGAARGEPSLAYGATRGFFSESDRAALLSPELGRLPYEVTVPRRLQEALGGGAPLDAVNAYAAIELSSYMRNTLLRDSDVMSMAHGLEVRVPLVDHVLVEAAMRAHGSIKQRRGESKPMLVASAPPLPREATHRKKMGFTLPFDAWFRGSLRPLLEDALRGAPVRETGLFDPRATERLWLSFLRGERLVTSSRVWSVASLIRWCAAHRVTL